ncbi:MAG: DUF2167 domain-containing protein, partial [Pyrinomonadaceae bacterium]
MKIRCIAILTIVCAFCLVTAGQNRKRRDRPSPTPEPTVDDYNVKWQKGPSVGTLGEVAEVKVPADYVFAGANDTRTIMEANQNPVSGKEVGFVSPPEREWFAVFEFDDVGYVRDDEKGELDAPALLQSIRAATETANQERQRRGWSIMTITGWEQPPRYNESTHNLEWAIRGESDGATVINHNTRLLGRRGVIEVTLVTRPENFAESLAQFKSMLTGFGFTQGQTYGEFRQGDRIAEYGLKGLIVGGGTAVLVKSGILKWLWKLI